MTQETEEIIGEALGDSPRAVELRAMRQALADRLAALQSESMGDKGAASQIAALKRQIEALRREEAVSQFVEDSVRYSLAKAMPEISEE